MSRAIGTGPAVAVPASPAVRADETAAISGAKKGDNGPLAHGVRSATRPPAPADLPRPARLGTATAPPIRCDRATPDPQPGRYAMPVPAAFAESNRAQTERLRKLVGRLDAPVLAARLPNGWTVAVDLAHLAFWDRQRLCLMRRWAAGDWCGGGYDGDLFNEALLPFLEAVPPERAAELALKSAEEVDAFLLAVPDDVVAAALARPDRPNLDRGSHREGHLDQIELALGAAE